MIWKMVQLPRMRHTYWIISCFFVVTQLSAQAGKEALYPINLVKFEFATTEMIPESRDFFSFVVERLKEGKDTFKQMGIILGPSYCMREIKIDPFIGVKRAKVILELLVEQTGFERSRISIIDRGPVSDPFPTAEIHCDMSHVTISWFYP